MSFDSYLTHETTGPTFPKRLTSNNGINGTTSPSFIPSNDYDTIWTATLDVQGNVTVNNTLCEGIDSAQPPATAPQF